MCQGFFTPGLIAARVTEDLPGKSTVASVSLFQFAYQPGVSRLSASSLASASLLLAGASNPIKVQMGG